MKIDLSKKFPKEIFNIIKIVGTLADENLLGVYIVGGVARDILLGLPNHDLDFVVEGDALKFSEVLNKKLKGPLKIYPAFKTATLFLKKRRIDLVTARMESYQAPGAYPQVTPATIKEDLFRRDFTINAMALSINKDTFGEVRDFYNGLKDIQKGVIRVMHDKSFIDDPTRIFRAVRFAARFDFKIEPHTRILIKKALAGGFLGEVNRGRIRKEVELFLREKDPLKCLEGFSKLW